MLDYHACGFPKRINCKAVIIEIDNVLVSLDILTECFCCDLSKCKGQCCVEGDAGAPVTIDEIDEMENYLEDVWQHLSASAQAVIDKQGVAYNDPDGDLVTSIVGGKDCVFTCYSDLKLSDETVENCCLCAYERLYRQGKIKWCKPISCALYPIREKTLKNGLVGITYNRWDVCKDAVKKGKEIGLPIYKFLREPLIKRFGQKWYDELCLVAEEVRKQNVR